LIIKRLSTPYFLFKL